MALTERQWSRVLTDIQDRQVVPVIGPELAVVNDGGRSMPLLQLVAGELAKRLDIDTSGMPERFSLDDVLSLYFRKADADPDEVYFDVRDIVTCSSWPTPEPLKQLAGVEAFDLFVSITFDTLLEQALDEARFGGKNRTKSFAYTRQTETVDLPAQYKPVYDAGEAAPLEPAVYHLFGKINPLKDYAVREEDVLQFGYRMQSRDLRPQNLFDLLRSRQLLLLGCNFPGWLTRFFLAAAKGDQLFTEGAHGLVADGSSAADKALVLFLERRRTQVYSQGNAVAFVDELSRRWTAAHPKKAAVSTVAAAAAAPGMAAAGTAPANAASLPEFKPDAVFISYASEDRPFAQAVRDALEGAGIDVWFDQGRLEPGDDFRQKILANIEQCSFFLPVISRNTTIAERRFFFLEWDKAVDEAKFRPKDCAFIMPVATDDTPPAAAHIPPEFKERQWLRLDGPGLPDTFVNPIRARIRDIRRERKAV